MPEKFVEKPPSGASDWRELWAEDRLYRPAGTSSESLLGAVRRILRRILGPDRDRQRDFNVAVLDLIGDIRKEIEEVRQATRRDIEALQHDVRTADEALGKELSSLHTLFQERVRVTAARGDALVVALDQKVEALAVRLRDLVNAPGAPAETARLAGSDDFVYRRLEDGLRGSEADIAESAREYVRLAAGHQPLFDAGCGRGELLLECRAAGVQARGCDTNERSVADLRARGLDVVQAGIPECFSGVADASLGSIVAIHVVEHLNVETLFALYREAARVLRSGGLLMIETPNAESIAVSASTFWRDPTHLAPRHAASLVLLGREHGFSVAEVKPVHEFPAGTAIPSQPDDPPALRRVIDALNERLFAPQDLRLILRKE